MYMYDASKRTAPHRRSQPEYKMLLRADAIKDIFSSRADFEMREIFFGLDPGQSLRVCWLDGIVSGTAVAEEVIRPLTELSRALGAGDAQ